MWGSNHGCPSRLWRLFYYIAVPLDEAFSFASSNSSRRCSLSIWVGRYKGMADGFVCVLFRSSLSISITCFHFTHGYSLRCTTDSIFIGRRFLPLWSMPTSNSSILVTVAGPARPSPSRRKNARSPTCTEICLLFFALRLDLICRLCLLAMLSSRVSWLRELNIVESLGTRWNKSSNGGNLLWTRVVFFWNTAVLTISTRLLRVLVMQVSWSVP